MLITLPPKPKTASLSLNNNEYVLNNEMNEGSPSPHPHKHLANLYHLNLFHYTSCCPLNYVLLEDKDCLSVYEIIFTYDVITTPP